MNQKFNPAHSWAKVIRERAARLGKSEREAALPVESEYLTALKEKAERLGVSIDKVKQLNHNASPDYPTPDCILPSELTDFMTGEEPTEALLLHLDECPPCYALLQMAAPSVAVLERLIEEVRICVGEQAAGSEAGLSYLFKSTLAKMPA
jgi:hypothetical protein